MLEFALFCASAIIITYGATAFAASYVYSQELPAELDRQIEEARAVRAQPAPAPAPAPAPKILLRDIPAPVVSAEAFLIANADTGEIFLEERPTYMRPIASITKLLTALTVSEYMDGAQVITIAADDRARSGGTPGSLAAGDSFTVGDLLYPLLMDSNNSVANAFARYSDTHEFVRLLNDKAHAMGMYGTHFEDPSGLSKYNISTANDLLTLVRFLHQHRPDVLGITTISSQKITAQNGRVYTLRNRNHFADDENFLGGKTGYTDEAKQTMVTLFDIPVGDLHVPLVIIVLGSDDRKKDVEALREWFNDAATVHMPLD